MSKKRKIDSLNSHLASLPQDLIIETTGFFSNYPERLELSNLCLNWRKASEKASYWKGCHLCGYVPQYEMGKAKFCTKVSLNLSSTENFQFHLVSSYLEKFSFLTHLTLDKIHIPEPMTLSNSLTHLKLTNEDHVGILYYNLFSIFFTQQRLIPYTLTHLTLDKVSFDKILDHTSYLQQITHLKLWDCFKKKSMETYYFNNNHNVFSDKSFILTECTTFTSINNDFGSNYTLKDDRRILLVTKVAYYSWYNYDSQSKLNDQRSVEQVDSNNTNIVKQNYSNNNGQQFFKNELAKWPKLRKIVFHYNFLTENYRDELLVAFAHCHVIFKDCILF